MAEWSKATASSTGLFGGVGSIPTSGSIQLLFFFLCEHILIHTHTHTKKVILLVITTPVRFELTRVEPIRFLI